MLAMRAELRNPNDEGHEVAAWLAVEDCLLNFERPPKTQPSSRADEHHDSNLVRIAVECRAKRSAALGDIGDSRVRCLVCALT